MVGVVGVVGRSTWDSSWVLKTGGLSSYLVSLIILQLS